MKKILCILIVITYSAMAQPLTYTATLNNPPAGYYFISAYNSLTVSYPMIFDEQGHVIYYKIVNASNSLDFKLNVNGQMSYFPSSLNKFLILDSTFNAVDTVASVGCITDGHELQVLPNGNYLILGYENVTEDLSAYNYFNHTGAPGNVNSTVKCSVVQELDASQNLLFDWHHVNHFPFDEVDTFFLNSPSYVDWNHANALQQDLDGNILISTRHFCEITKINRNTGNVMWHFGGKYNQFTFLNDTVPFYGQHDIRVWPNGHITFYDNGYHSLGNRHAARAVEYELDTVNMTAKLVWSYKYDTLMISNSQGSVQLLPNGNRLINYGTVNKDSVCFNMVDSLGNEVYKIRFSSGAFSYRCHYYPALPWQLHRPTISCLDSLGTYYLKVDSAYSSYQWSTGSTQNMIPITTTGSYYVYVPYGPQGYISSYVLNITDLNMQCASVTSVAGADHQLSPHLYPNPARNEVTFVCAGLDNNVKPELHDVFGNRIEIPAISRNANSITFDISRLNAGVYFVSAQDKTCKFIKCTN